MFALTITARSKRRWRGALLAVALAAAAMMPIAGARAASLADLTGWWIAVDSVFPLLWQNGVTPSEELLMINTDGRVENRVMNFYFGTAATCATRKVCSDAALIARGRLSVADDRLAFTDLETTDDPVAPDGKDSVVRAAGVTTVSAWGLSLSADMRAMTLQADDKVRAFAKIEPRHLQRLRAAMLASRLRPEQVWRCFLANATADDAAFAPLRAPSSDAAVPDILAPYLEAASYLHTLDRMLAHPTADDPDPRVRALLPFEAEEYMVEPFDGVNEPVTMADKQALVSLRPTASERVSEILSSDPEAARRLFCQPEPEEPEPAAEPDMEQQPEAEQQPDAEQPK